jgi:drug/metabolite transporter (DMT)-like permease
LEWTGAAAGVAGSALIATGHVGAGFCLFLLSNFLLAGYAILARAWGLLSMQAIYTVTSVYGVLFWLS